MQISQKIKAAALSTTLGALVSMPAVAEVKSLSSSELTETYIEDSTIIVTPKAKKSPDTQKKTVSSLTIVPTTSTEQDLAAIEYSQAHLNDSSTSFALSDELLRNTNVVSAINPAETVTIQPYREVITQPVADILDDERYRPPTGDFELNYQGSDLGISRAGDQFTFSIGTPPGVDPVNLPYAINEGPLQINPRPDGGFDLTINIPQDN